jgi:hypothetical protein
MFIREWRPVVIWSIYYLMCIIVFVAIPAGSGGPFVIVLSICYLILISLTFGLLVSWFNYGYIAGSFRRPLHLRLISVLLLLSVVPIANWFSSVLIWRMFGLYPEVKSDSVHISPGLVNESHVLFWRPVVRPPICCLCDCGFETGRECALVAFTQVPEDVANSLRRGCEDPPEHPPHLEWFCPQHIPLAMQLVHLTCKQAVTQLQSLGVAESNSAAGRPILDDLFLSECPACGNWAGWTGLIEAQGFDELNSDSHLEKNDAASSSSTSQLALRLGLLDRILKPRKASDASMGQVELGVLMYCLVCSNQFLVCNGALQDFLRHSPPTFIPGRRLSERL